MAQRYGFFNSINNDRTYDASDVARFLSNFFTNGIFNNGLAVSSNDNMTVSIAIGNANINGYVYENTESLTLDVEVADNELSRIDSVVVRLDLTNRQITTQITQGQYASSPSQPTLTRSGNIYDLRLANILVPAGASRITAEQISDTRFGSDCGNVVQAVQYLDTADIFAQYENYFNNWFNELQDELNSNQAGNLQSEINNNRLALGLYVDNYDSEQTYAVGDMVIKNHTIYECITAITTAEEWTVEHWIICPIILEEE